MSPTLHTISCCIEKLNRWYTEDGVDGVPGDLDLGSIANEAFGVSESDVRRGGPVAVIVGDDLDTAMVPDSDARVGGAEVNSNYEMLCIFGHRNMRMQREWWSVNVSQ
jgi:hypothetical protein